MPSICHPKAFSLYDDVSRFVALNKYIDGSRETVSDMGGNRDGILARLGETYLDAIQKDGHALTSEEKKQQQNPGY